MVYENIKKYIAAHGLKQCAVADKSGIPERVFSAIVTGKRRLLVEEFVCICNALNVSADTLLHGGET